jgi:penicillin-binding protein 1A
MVHLRTQLNRLLVQWNQLRRNYPRELRMAIRVTVASAIVCVLAATWFLLSLSRGLPDRESLTSMTEMAQATAVYDASDALAFTIFKEQRIEVPLDAMGPYLVKALVAVEDQRFYDHHGFDAIRIAGAALNNVWHVRRGQGASTITQQLARTSFLTPDKTYRRKLQEGPRVLCEACRRSDTRRSGNHRRTGEVAVQLCADGEP